MGPEAVLSCSVVVGRTYNNTIPQHGYAAAVRGAPCQNHNVFTSPSVDLRVEGNRRTGLRAVPPAGVENADAGVTNSSPNDHFTVSPHCRVSGPAVGALLVPVAVQLSVLGLYLPPVSNPS